MMRALVLSGGGSKGAYQVGVLSRWLDQEKIGYDLYAGVSVGAINALHLAQYAKGQERTAWADLRDLWLKLTTRQVHKRWFPFGRLHGLWQPSLYNSAPLREFLVGHVDRDKILQSGKMLRMGVVSLHTGEYRIFDETTEDLLDAVLASASFPVFLLPQKIGEDLCTDGGVRNVTPLKAAIDAGADRIDVIMTTTDPPRYSPLDETPSAIDVAGRVLDIMTDEIIEGDIKQALLYNDLVRATGTDVERRWVDIRIVRPATALDSGGSLTFDPEKIRGMIARGEEDARTCLT